MAPNQTTQSTSDKEHAPSAPIKHRPHALSKNLFSEEERLQTFQGWPSTFVSPEELSSNGFYFTGIDDVARCVFCGLEVGQWVEGDSASADHTRFSPDCDFLRGRPCGNIPLGASSASSSLTSSCPPSFDTCGPYGHLIRPYSGPERPAGSIPPALLEDLEQLGVNSGPVAPRYCTEDARLRSFVDWPESCPVRPEVLAAAGFYSTHVDDHAVCFHCGGGLKDWEEGDDPWVEHARWFSRCPFVVMHKGREFIASVGQKKPALLPVGTLKALLKKASDERREESACAVEDKSPESAMPKVFDASKDPENLRETELCKICYARERTVVFLPCGHFVCCCVCATALSRCPVCRKPYEATVRAYLS